MSKQLQENKMGTMPVPRLVATMSLPIILSMVVQALYNVVDSYFVAQVSREALTAVGQAFSAQNLMIGIATGTGVGVNALLSRALGEKNPQKANRIAGNGLLLALVGYLIVLLFGLLGTDLYFRGILSSANLDGGLDLEAVRQAGNDYLQICTIFSFGLFGQILFERLIQATGRAVFTLYSQGVGALINILLDPIFILEDISFLPFSGFGMGAKGAAIATVIGQIVAMILGFILNQKFNREIRFSLSSLRPDLKIIGNIYSIGIPSIIMVAVGSVMYYLINMIVMTVSSVGSTLFGVYFKLQSFVFMPLFGINNGVIPIMGYNFGAGNRRRLEHTVRTALLFACFFMGTGLFLMQWVPDLLIGLFESDPTVIALGCTALRIISLSFLFAGFSVILSAVFQALGKGVYSMFVSIARQLLVLVPVAWFLSRAGQLDLIWWAFPIAEVISLAVSLGCFLQLRKRIISKIPLGV